MNEKTTNPFKFKLIIVILDEIRRVSGGFTESNRDVPLLLIKHT